MRLDGVRLGAYRLYGALPVFVREAFVRVVTPSFRVAAACVLMRPDGTVLLVRHSYRKGWGLPGGLIRRGEEPAVGAVREAREEIGVEVELDGEPKVVIHPEGRRVDVVYAARVAAGSPAQEPYAVLPEIVEVGWFDPSRFPRLQEEAATALGVLRGDLRTPRAST